jgi:carbon monoxide dehydrogenase subunit G
VYKQTVTGPGGRSVPADFRMTALDPDTRVAFDCIAGPVRPTGEFLFAPEGEGTRVSFTLRVELGGLKSLVMGGPVAKAMDEEVAALSKAKAHLEGA